MAVPVPSTMMFVPLAQQQASQHTLGQECPAAPQTAAPAISSQPTAGSPEWTQQYMSNVLVQEEKARVQAELQAKLLQEAMPDHYED
eukprot:770120-Amphidinium_carterae.1